MLVVAGDFTVARKIGQLKLFVQSVSKSVLFVAGNHDYYGGSIEEVDEYLETMDREFENFHFLNNRSIVLEDVQFFGCTLWSNYDLAPKQDYYAQKIAPFINDFWEINRDVTHKFTPYDCWAFNEESREFLKQELGANKKGKNIVITHFLPSSESIHKRYENSDLNPYFCCNCEGLMGENVPLWIHGHTHESMDYSHGFTRVIANPRGYYGENKRFDGKLIIDL